MEIEEECKNKDSVWWYYEVNTMLIYGNNMVTWTCLQIPNDITVLWGKPNVIISLMWYNVIMWAYPMLNLPILEGFMRFLPHRNGWIWGMVFNWVYHIKKARRNDVAGFVSHVGMMGLWHAHFISFYRHNFSRYWTDAPTKASKAFNLEWRSSLTMTFFCGGLNPASRSDMNWSDLQ